MPSGIRRKRLCIFSGTGREVKPLFYTIQGDTLIFSSEIKGLFQYPGVEAVADKESLCGIFALGPAKSYGKGVFRNILEVEGGSRLLWKDGRLRKEQYWQLQSRPHEDSFEETVEKNLLAGGGCGKASDAFGYSHLYLSLRRGGQFPGHSHLCQGAEETGKGTPYFLL